MSKFFEEKIIKILIYYLKSSPYNYDLIKRCVDNII